MREKRPPVVVSVGKESERVYLSFVVGMHNSLRAVFVSTPPRYALPHTEYITELLSHLLRQKSKRN